jgi:mRNA interferase RelE/StbE
MLNVLRSPDIERRLSELAERTGRAESDVAREPTESNIERTLKTAIWPSAPLRKEVSATPAIKCVKNLGWNVEYSPAALRHLKKLDRAMAAEVLDYMDRRVATATDPRDFGKILRHQKFGLWRYRVRDYRIICELE